MNFNGKISDWEIKVAAAVSTSKELTMRGLLLLEEIRDAVAPPSVEIKTQTRRGYAGSTATTVMDVPVGQEYIITHVGCVAAVSLFLDGRILGVFTGNSGGSEVIVGPGELTVTCATPDTDYVVQVMQRTSGITKKTGQGHVPAPGLMTGGGLDQEPHFDHNRVEIPQAANR